MSLSIDKKSRAYHHGDLRAALLQAAEAMLERVGPEELSLRELTREIGVSSNAPRRHFPSKQVLLDVLAMEGFARLGAALDLAASSDEPDFVRRLVKIAHARIHFSATHQSLSRLMFAAKQRPDAPPELLEAGFEALLAGPRTIAYGQIVGAVVEGDTKQLALTVFASVEGLIALAVEGKFAGTAIEALAEKVINNIMLGLMPRSGSSLPADPYFGPESDGGCESSKRM